LKKTLLNDLMSTKKEMLDIVKTKKSISPEFEKDMHNYMSQFVGLFK